MKNHICLLLICISFAMLNTISCGNSQNSPYSDADSSSSIGQFYGAIGNLSGATGSGIFSGASGAGEANGALCSTLISLFPNATPSWCMGGIFVTGSGSGVTFDGPLHVLVDSANNLLYVADSNKGRIVKLNLSTGSFISAIGKISGSVPAGCAVDGNNTTISWCAASNAVYVNGDVDGSFNTPMGLAMDSDYLYVINQTGSAARLTRVALATGAFAGSVGRISGSIPSGCSVDNGTNKVTTTWCTGAFYVGGSASLDGAFNNPRNLAIAKDTSGITYLYVTDSQTRVERYVVSDPTSSHLPSGFFAGAIGQTSSQSNTPTAFTNQNAPLCLNNVNPSNYNIATRWCTGGTFTTGQAFFPNDGSFFNASGIAVDPMNNHMYVSNTPGAYFGPQRIQKFNLTTGSFIGAIGYSSAAGSGPNPCLAGVNTSWCTGGNFQNPNNDTKDGMFNDTTEIAIDLPHGVLYTSDGSANRIQKIQTSTGAFMGSIGLTNGTSTGTCPSNEVATLFCTGGTFNSSSSQSIDGAFSNPAGIAVDPLGGFLYVADRGNNRIVRIR